MMWKDKFNLRMYEHSEVRKDRDSERRGKLANSSLKPMESIVGLILIGIVSILILVMVPKVMQNRGINNLLKLLYSGISILAVLGVLATPLGIYRYIKGRK